MARETPDAPPPEGFIATERTSPFTEMIGTLYDLPGDPENRRGFRVQPGHINNAGILHGGMMMTFADTLLGRAVENSGGGPSVTLHMTTDFLGPALLGDWVEGTAKVVRQTRTLVFVEGEIRSRRRLVMTAKGVFRRLSRRRGRGG